MTLLTGAVRQPRFWLRLLVLVAVPLMVTLLLGQQAWAAPAPEDPCKPNHSIPNLECEPPPPPKNLGKVLGIFDVVDENGVPLSAYGLNVDQGGTLDVISKIIAFLIGLGFNVIKVVIGFACWLVDWALGFGLAKALLNPVSDIAGTIRAQVIDNLGLPGLFLMIVALWGGYHILFKRRSKGWSEIAMSLVIASIAGVTLADPGRVLIGNADDSGVLGTTKQFSMHIADVVLDDMCKTPPAPPPGEEPKKREDLSTTCTDEAKKSSEAQAVSRPITDGLVDAFVQRPVWVLYTGKPIDSACSDAYGKSVLVRYNFNRLVMPKLIEEQKDKEDGWLNGLREVFSEAFSLDGLTDSLLLATGNPWAIYTVIEGEQQEAVEKLKNVAVNHDAWKQYVVPADAQVKEKCGGAEGPVEDQQIAASVDNLISVWFIAIAAIIVVCLVLAVSITFLVSQVWMAVEVIRAQPALVAGILPGGGRTVMWNWVAGVFRVVLAIFLSVMFLVFFLVMVIALLNADTGEVMTVKFLAIDFLALAFLMFRKKVTAAAKTISKNLGDKLNSSTGGGGASVFNGAASGGPKALDQLKNDASTLSSVGRGARRLWAGKPGGGAGGGGGQAGGDGTAGKPKKNLKQRVQGAVKLGTQVAAAVGTGGTTAAVQATAKTALKNRLKNAAKKRLEKNRVGRATLATARTGRYLGKEAPITRSRFRNAVAAERRNLEDASRPPADNSARRTRDAQRDASRRMRDARSQTRDGGQRLNGAVNGRRSQQRNQRRSSGSSGSSGGGRGLNNRPGRAGGGRGR
ncbi:hypothetical protein ACIQ7Q_08120 [Streptomyces sp. NPDC096176]|uniref:hypothetical protein n=1 Tax=Streptomyces sp. NPDC096176 TaxID=3366079 RepID=UPI00382FED95